MCALRAPKHTGSGAEVAGLVLYAEPHSGAQWFTAHEQTQAFLWLKPPYSFF